MSAKIIAEKMTTALTIVVLIFLSSVIHAAPADNGKLTVRIIHTNDMHSRFNETSQLSNKCWETDRKAGRCYGGIARIATLVRQARRSASLDQPVFFLNAGDTFQGTKFYIHYKWRIVARFMNILRPDVTSLGNHEFDDGVGGLVPYLNNISFPVVAANLNLKDEPSLAEARQLRKSTILHAKNRKIGVIGYLTPETKMLSKTENVTFIDEVEAIREEARNLKSQGVDIIIALGHSGFEVDKKIGREVEDVDLVIGGHTNTFLYNGPQPDSEKIEGSYPTVVVQPSGRKVYVVQAYAYTKYLGDLTIDFDGNGEITRIEGQPILVDSSIPQADDVEAELQRWDSSLKNALTVVLGTTKVLLQGSEKVCRLWECNYGNLIADAMVNYNAKRYKGSKKWTDAPIAIYQAGGIRTSIDPVSDVKITMDDILTSFPFETFIFKMNLTGEALKRIFEFSVQDRIDHNTTSHGGGFLQVSGLQVVYNISKPINSRVISVKARCSDCNVPAYEDLDMATTYTVLLPDFIYFGGDGYTMFSPLPYTNLTVKNRDVVMDYLAQMSPVYPDVEGRIRVLYATDEQSSSPSAATKINYSWMILIILLICLVRLI